MVVVVARILATVKGEETKKISVRFEVKPNWNWGGRLESGTSSLIEKKILKMTNFERGELVVTLVWVRAGGEGVRGNLNPKLAGDGDLQFG